MFSIKLSIYYIDCICYNNFVVFNLTIYISKIIENFFYIFSTIYDTIKSLFILKGEKVLWIL